MNWWQFLLFPVAIIYDIVTRCRNWLFDLGLYKGHSFPKIFTISVGNLAVGGTGKTPMVEYLIRLGLDQGWQIATLSRGYGRKSKGVMVGDKDSTSEGLGDESYGYLEQFGASIKVVVAEVRVAGIQQIINSFPEVNVVILDDAFQHRHVKPDFSILLTTFKKPFWKDFILPSGTLREASLGHQRADHVLVTKCPKDISKEFVSSVQRRLSGPSIGCTTIRYGNFISVAGTEKESFVGVAAIANNQDFFAYVQTHFGVVERIGFPDHHDFSPADVQKIADLSNKLNATVVCTYKDYVKLKSHKKMGEISWGYVPIEVCFLEGEKEFQETLKARQGLHNMES